MKLLHTSDLHLGLRMGEYSLIEDQRYILDQIINIATKQGVDYLIIAGDVYDKAIPSAEAVSLFDYFLTALSRASVKVLLISGNHDSAERLAFASALIEDSGVRISPVFSGGIEPIVDRDQHGEVRFYLLPFIKPASVRRFYPDCTELSYTEAVKLVVDGMKLNTDIRNILVTHQFVTGATRSESEEISVGGTDNVDSSVFSDFDYVALGHIHSPQCCGKETVNYSGTPLKYSLSEVNDKKSVTLVELFEKGRVQINRIPLTPLRDLSLIKGSYNEITARSFYDGRGITGDYLGVCLTDELDVPDAISKLRVIYKNLVKLWYENSRTANMQKLCDQEDGLSRDPMELFEEFYRLRNGNDMTEAQHAYMKSVIERVWEEADETD